MVVKRGSGASTGFLKEFQEFALKGNVVDLAVAVIIGGAFGKIVSSFVADVVMPIVNPLIPGGDWRKLTLPPGINIGSFMGSIVDFVIIALVLFLTLRTLAKFKKSEVAPTAAPTLRECPHCLEMVPIAATRCRACTSELTPLGPLS
jgi:large conductance mechanosensitive channel